MDAKMNIPRNFHSRSPHIALSGPLVVVELVARNVSIFLSSLRFRLLYIQKEFEKSNISAAETKKTTTKVLLLLLSLSVCVCRITRRANSALVKSRTLPLCGETGVRERGGFLKPKTVCGDDFFPRERLL